ncbi:penicillin-binding protein [Lysobacteraceae bacterium NML120232]|nr:penicillin-binding protein [Xanthomonadaceae bacterium NML120232]
MPVRASDDVAFIEAEVDAAVARYQLPGIAVGVLRDGEIIARVARGETRIGSGEKIDADSIFKIASNTKAMTGALLARLVDQGRLAWDDPVIRHLPDFRMYEDWVTREIQVRDLLIHNSGLPAGAGDLMLWPSPNQFSRADVLHGLRYLKPQWSFRSRYAYDNTLYIVAGEVAAAAGGAPYEHLMQQEVFAPLGLSRCRVGQWRQAELGNVAQPHRLRDGRFEVSGEDGEIIPHTPMAAAGGVRCSLNDMLHWAQMWLAPDKTGVQAGKPWLSKTQRDALWQAHMPMPLSARMRAWDHSHYYAYGYGWRLSDIDGTARVAHTGTLNGMYSALTLLPEKNIGIVLLINADAAEARTVLMQSLTKRFTAPGNNPGVAGYARLLADEAAAGKQGATHAALPDTSDRRPATAGQLAAVLGQWHDPWFGQVSICPEGEAVRWRSEKSPAMFGQVMSSRHGWLVAWEGARLTEAWLRPANGKLRMAKLDPDGDFSDDFEDLEFSRSGDCPAN